MRVILILKNNSKGGGNTMNERIKELRKFLGLSGEKFGERIRVAKSTISNIEKGNRNVTEQQIKLICTEFGVSEEWLRTGTGEMFVPITADDEFAMVVGEIIKSEDVAFKTAIIEAWKRPELRKLVWEYVKVLQEKS